jgi:hypothetical protein
VIALLCCGFTLLLAAVLLPLYCCFTAALLLLYCCFTAQAHGRLASAVPDVIAQLDATQVVPLCYLVKRQ